jgi:hypothetical protein
VFERHAGRTLQQIADTLNQDGVATARGGSRWYASTIRGALHSAMRDEDARAEFQAAQDDARRLAAEPGMVERRMAQMAREGSFGADLDSRRARWAS